MIRKSTAGFFILLFILAFQQGVLADGGAVKVKILCPDREPMVYTVHGGAGKKKGTVIFIHGGFADRSFWSKQTGVFEKDYRVVAVDLVCHGESGRNRKKISMKDYARDLEVLLKQENISRAVLVGNSMGGPIALETALLAPERVIGVVGADSLHDLTVEIPAELLKQMASGFRTDFKATAKGMVKDVFRTEVDPALREHVAAAFSDHTPEMAVALMDSFIDYESCSVAKKLDIPIRCINGDAAPTKIEKNRVCHPDFDAVILKNTGHYPMLERPEQFNRHLEKILEHVNSKEAKGYSRLR